MANILYTPLHLANTFVERHPDARDLTHMKLQKLAYYAYGWWLGVKGTKLTAEGPQVWRYGPVFRSVYSALTTFANNPIPAPVRANPFVGTAPIIALSEDEESLFIDWIWERYGGMSAAELSRQTHLPGSPWYQIAVEYNFQVPPYLPMNDDLIRSHFESMARAEGVI